jgi:hypothetical protein
VPYLHRFSRREGVSVGGGGRAELVNGEATTPATSEQLRQQMRVDAAYREWVRNRSDVDKLREPQAVVTKTLDVALTRV